MFCVQFQDYEHIGRAFCETLMDYSDENPIKVMRIKRRLKKIRKRERRLLKVARLKKLAEECIMNEKNCAIVTEKSV